MELLEERLNKARLERIAREKARIDKLRQLNLKKYSQNDTQSSSKMPSMVSLENKKLKSSVKPTNDVSKNNFKRPGTSNQVKKNSNANGTSNRPGPSNKVTVDKAKPIMKNGDSSKTTFNVPKVVISHVRNTEKKDFVNSNKIIANYLPKLSVNAVKNGPNITRKTLAPVKITKQFHLQENESKASDQPNLTSKSMVPVQSKETGRPKDISRNLSENPKGSRKSMLPVRPVSVTNNRESVFDRLYKPKIVQKTELSDTERLKRGDPIFLQKVLHKGSRITHRRQTIAPTFAKPVTKEPVRRSISAVHLKRISKLELGNCFHKWSSIGEKLNEIDVTSTNEDDKVKQDTVTSAIKSERKQVRIQTRASFTPHPEELQSRLQKWLKSRGKSIDSYQHLQCFGIQHLAEKPLQPLFLKPEVKEFDEENKENIELEHDSDNDSYTDCINDQDGFNDVNDKTKWRSRVSCVSDSVCLNDSDHDTTLNSEELHMDDVLLGALNDLTELLREGFDWEQCARWLRAIRTSFPHATSLAPYWECRAALEETRGDLPASVQCWEEAIAKGTQHSVADANLDQLLDKFMQLKISPNSGKRDKVDPKLVDVKNVFKSTIIRFAVQQAKIRQSNQSEQPTFTVTPVRRSGRLSSWSVRKTPRYQQIPKTPKVPKTPLQICTSVRQAGLLGEKVLFVPNATLCDTP